MATWRFQSSGLIKKRAHKMPQAEIDLVPKRTFEVM